MSIHGSVIRDRLQHMRLVLIRTSDRGNCDYHVSRRGVPYVHLYVNGVRHQFTFFGRSKKFRLFAPDQSHIDFYNWKEVIDFYVKMKALGIAVQSFNMPQAKGEPNGNI